MAHVGVLEELEKAGVTVDLIVGCSAGSIVGALYANDPDACKLREHLMHLKRKDLMDFSWLSARFGLSEGRLLRQRIERELTVEEFDDLQIPLFVVATDLDDGQLVTISSGPIAPAVQGSCAVPLFFQPVCWNGKLLVDGGVLDPTPVEVAKQQNPDIIIAVDLSEMLPQSRPTNLFGVAKRCFEIRLVSSNERLIQEADVLIQPDLSHVGLFDDDSNQEVYEAGRIAAQEAIPAILEKLESQAGAGSIVVSEEESVQDSFVGS